MDHFDKVSLQDIRVAVLISDGFEDHELIEPVHELTSAGAAVEILAQTREQMQRGIQAIHGMRMTETVHPKALIQDVAPNRYQGLFIPGGALSADRMRESRLHLGFVQNFFAEGKPVGVIGHSAWLLADSGVAQGKTLTSWPAIRKDLERAGAVWKNQDVLCDGNLITSRNVQDVPRFLQAFMEELAKLYNVSKKVA